MRRKIFASAETSFIAHKAEGKAVKVYSFFPVDRADCDCMKLATNWKIKLGHATEKERQKLLTETPFITCPRSHSPSMKRYKVVCRNCNEIQGYCYATDKTLKNWCDFHYVQWTKGDYWRGCFTPHISPITQELCFECCCGQDTRDFRANMTLNKETAERYERKNSKGRTLNMEDSKFAVIQVRSMIP